VADGILLHAFTTEEYIRSVTLPAMEAGLAKSGRSREDVQLVGSPFFITGETEEEFNRVKLAACNQIAFYGSTPAYKEVLASVGYGDLFPELNRLSKAGEWVEMGRRIDDTLLDRIAIVGEPQQIGEKLKNRYGDIFDICAASVFTGEGYSAGAYHRGIGDVIKSVSR